MNNPRTKEHFPKMKARGVHRRDVRMVRRMVNRWKDSESETLQLAAAMLNHWLAGGSLDLYETPGHTYVLLEEGKKKR